MRFSRLQSQLPAFIEVAEKGSFSAAARHMNLAPATISKAIRELEGKLGIRLFHRSTHAVRLTDEGRVLFEQIAESMGRINEALDTVGERGSTPSGRLKVSLLVSFGHRYIMPLAMGFLEKYPGVELDLRFEDRHVDLIGEGFDVGIGVQSELGLQTVARSLCELDMVTVAAPGYLERWGTPKIPEDLRNHQCVISQLLSSGRPTLWRFQSGHREITVEPRGRLTVSSYRAVRQAVLGGYGVAHLGYFQVAEDIRHGKLVPILEGYEPPPMNLRIFYPSRTGLPNKVRVFIDYIFEHFDFAGGRRAPGDGNPRGESQSGRTEASPDLS